MALLEELDAEGTALAMGYDADTRRAIPWNAARAVLATALWAWFDAHEHERIVKITVKLWILPVRATLKVSDLRLPITFIFGPHP